jgi:hypothetical protein
MRSTRVLIALAASVPFAAAPAARAADASLPSYTATYQAYYKGHHVGSTEFTLGYDKTAMAYVFTNETQARGLLKLARPKPAVDRSQFRYENGQIVPQEFWYEDGSRKGEDNSHTVFDWNRQRAIVTDKDGTHNVPLSAGVLDTGCVQVALMLALQADKTPGPYRLLDDHSISTYSYMLQGSETVDTPYGKIEATRVQQQSKGSSRTTYIWSAPSLQFLPAKIEQRKDGEVLSSFVLESVQGLGAHP